MEIDDDLDATGLRCPLPVLKARKRLQALPSGSLLRVMADDPAAIIDMPTMWVHSITNTGQDELITLFYADEIYDPATPDTYPEEV